MKEEYDRSLRKFEGLVKKQEQLLRGIFFRLMKFSNHLDTINRPAHDVMVLITYACLLETPMLTFPVGVD